MSRLSTPYSEHEKREILQQALLGKGGVEEVEQQMDLSHGTLDDWLVELGISEPEAQRALHGTKKSSAFLPTSHW